MNLVVDSVNAMFSAKARYTDKCARSKMVTRSTLRSGDNRNRYIRGIVNQDFDVDSDRVLGKGCSGAVVAARCRRTGREVAVKTYAKNEISKNRLDSLRSEVNIYLTMEHPHIATLLAVYESTDSLSLVMELCSGGELHDRLSKKSRFTEEEARRAAHQMCTAIAYLHQLGVVHRDLKLENWLYSNESEDAPLKLIDFGFSLKWDQKKLMSKCLGSTHYMAPEVFMECYSEKCDLWSFGVIVYTLLVGTQPFRAGNETELIAKIQEGQWSFPEDCGNGISGQARDFVQKLLTVDAQKRMSVEECLQHPWLQAADELPSLLTNFPRRTRSAMADFEKENVAPI